MSFLHTFILSVLTTKRMCYNCYISIFNASYTIFFSLFRWCMHLWRRLLSKLSPSHTPSRYKHRSHNALVYNCCWFLIERIQVSRWYIITSSQKTHWRYNLLGSINLSSKWIPNDLFTTLRFQCLSYLLMMFL